MKPRNGIVVNTAEGSIASQPLVRLFYAPILVVVGITVWIIYQAATRPEPPCRDYVVTIGACNYSHALTIESGIAICRCRP